MRFSPNISEKLSQPLFSQVSYAAILATTELLFSMLTQWCRISLFLVWRIVIGSEDLKLYWWTFFSFHFINTPRSAAAQRIDSHQMYSRGSVVGEVSLTDPEISPALP